MINIIIIYLKILFILLLILYNISINGDIQMADFEEFNNDYSEIFPIDGQEGKKSYGALEERTLLARSAGMLMAKTVPFLLVGSMMVAMSSDIISPSFAFGESSNGIPPSNNNNSIIYVDNNHEENKANETSEPIMIGEDKVVFVDVVDESPTPTITPVASVEPTIFPEPTVLPTFAPEPTIMPTATPEPTPTPTTSPIIPTFESPVLSVKASYTTLDKVNDKDNIQLIGQFVLESNLTPNDGTNITLNSVIFTLADGTNTDITSDVVVSDYNVTRTFTLNNVIPDANYSFTVEYGYYEDDIYRTISQSASVTTDSIASKAPVLSLQLDFTPNNVNDGANGRTMDGNLIINGNVTANDASDISIKKITVNNNDSIDYVSNVDLNNDTIATINDISLTYLFEYTSYDVSVDYSYILDEIEENDNITASFTTPMLPYLGFSSSFKALNSYYVNNFQVFEGELVLTAEASDETVSIDENSFAIEDGTNSYELNNFSYNKDTNEYSFSLTPNSVLINANIYYAVSVDYKYKLSTDSQEFGTTAFAYFEAKSPITVNKLSYNQDNTTIKVDMDITCMNLVINDDATTPYDFVWVYSVDGNSYYINFTDLVTRDPNDINHFTFSGLPKSAANEDINFKTGQNIQNYLIIQINATDDNIYQLQTQNVDITMN